jgi:hypothetical protein
LRIFGKISWIGSIPFLQFACNVQVSSPQPLLECVKHRLAVTHKLAKVEVQNIVERGVDGSIVGGDFSIAEKLDASLYRVCRISRAKTQPLVALAGIAMLLPLAP